MKVILEIDKMSTPSGVHANKTTYKSMQNFSWATMKCSCAWTFFFFFLFLSNYKMYSYAKHFELKKTYNP